jgi:hypothetical protein
MEPSTWLLLIFLLLIPLVQTLFEHARRKAFEHLEREQQKEMTKPASRPGPTPSRPRARPPSKPATTTPRIPRTELPEIAEAPLSAEELRHYPISLEEILPSPRSLEEISHEPISLELQPPAKEQQPTAVAVTPARSRRAAMARALLQSRGDVRRAVLMMSLLGRCRDAMGWRCLR